MVKLADFSRCLHPGCTWTPEGDPYRAAGKHQRDTGHPVATWTEAVTA